MAVAANGNGVHPQAGWPASDLLRLSTVGSVDDGKSTLIGRLLHDSKGIFEDQLAAIERASERRGDGYVNLALLTDGLRAEREQGITIDVAYRYFATPRRKFIVADTPGHIQYTRNMVTGGSTADLSIVLVDARRGVVEQTRRHAVIASLLGIPHLVVAVNKMDLVGYDETVFEAVRAEFLAFADRLEARDVTFIPISALQGDNVVEPSGRMPWYAGPPLLRHLEEVEVESDHDLVRRRFPVQWVIRPNSDAHHDYRGYAGRVEGGVFRPGDDVIVLPAGLRSRVRSIETLDGSLAQAVPPLSVSLTLEDDVDVGRGDMIAGADDPPRLVRELDGVVCWMTDRPLQTGGRYVIKHTTRYVKVIVSAVDHRLDVNTLHRDPSSESLGLNELGRVAFRLSGPLLVDPYRLNRTTGSFIVIDEATNNTVGAGMIVDPTP